MWPVCLFHSSTSIFYFQLFDTYGVISTSHTYGVISTLCQVFVEIVCLDERPTSKLPSVFFFFG